METPQAIRLLEGAVPPAPGIWADLGCGSGTFTLALAELLGAAARIYAVDNDAGALSSLRRRAAGHGNVIPVEADFTRPFVLPERGGMLDGFLLANSLHFVRDAESVLARIAARLRPEGRVVLVEYDRRTANRYVPYPIPPARLEKLAASAGFSTPMITATHPSAFHGKLYTAFLTRLAPGTMPAAGPQKRTRDRNDRWRSSTPEAAP